MLIFFVATSEGKAVIIEPVAETGSEDSVPAVFNKLAADQLSTNGACFCDTIKSFSSY